MTARTLTLRRAIVLTVVLSLLIPALLINGYSWHKKYTEGIQKQTHDLLELNADVLSNGMQEPLWNINHESGTALLNAMMSRNEDIVRIQVRDNALGIFVSGERQERRTGYTASSEKPVTYRGNAIGSIQLEVGSTRLHKVMIVNLIEQMASLGAQVALSIAFILILLEVRLIRPLQQLGRGAKRLAARELDMPFTWQRLDEIGLLSQRLEGTRISLRRLFGELEQDIDKRKRIEQELHEREERFRVLVEQSPIAIIEWDSNYCVVEWNAAAERIFGSSREQALGRHASFITPDISRESVDATFRKLTAGSGVAHRVFENLRADGQIITCQWSGTRVDDKTGVTGRLLSMAEDITEKRRAEEAQSLSEAKFSGAFQCNPDSVTITRISDGQIIDVNEHFETVTGFSRNDVVGKNALDLNLWVNPAEREALFGQLKRGKIARDYPWSMRTRYGDIRKCLTNATIFMVGGESCAMAVIRDVTEQRLLEEQKAEADHALLRLAQGTRGMAGESFFGLLVADLASALRTERAFIGLRQPDAPDHIRTIAAHLHGHLVENFEYVICGAPCERILAGDIRVFSSGLQIQFPDDHALAEQHWESYAGAPLRDAAGNTIGVLAVMHSEPLGNPDLVKSLLQVFSERASAELERKRAEEALRTSEQRFSTMFQSSPVAMFVTQVRGNHVIKDVNSAFERLFLRPRDAVIGKNTIELALYNDTSDRSILIEELMQAGSTHDHEIWMNRGDTVPVLVQISGHTFFLSGEKFGILACQDVTDKRRIENEIRELNATLEERVIERTEELQQANQELALTLDTLNLAQEELVRSEKLAALGALVAGIAHELNTPIGNSLMVASTLVDQTRMLTRQYAIDKGIKRSMLESYIADAGRAGDIMVRNLDRAANLVTSFKQVAMDQTSSQRRRFSLAEMISEIMLTLSPMLKKTAFTVTENIPDDLLLDSYPGPLGQVVTNLLNNVLLHAFDKRDEGSILIEARAGGAGWVELMVRDDGAGIPANNLNRIFDPFFTTKLGAGGSGLGLNITHNIVSGVLGGRIRVQSEVGVGTTFIISLPTVAPQKQVEAEAMPGNSSG